MSDQQSQKPTADAAPEPEAAEAPQPQQVRRRRRRGRPSPYPAPDTTSAAARATLQATATRPKAWLLDGWPARREVTLKRLGEWAHLTMLRLNVSTRDLEALAASTGEAASAATFQRLVAQRLRESHPAVARERISFSVVLWLATLAGQSLADVDRYLRSGETRDLAPGIEAQADTLRGAFLALSPARQQALSDFAQHLYYLDMAEQAPVTLPRATAATAPTATTHIEAVTPGTAADAEAEVRRARADLERAYERLEAQDAQEQPPQDEKGQHQGKRRRNSSG